MACSIIRSWNVVQAAGSVVLPQSLKRDAGQNRLANVDDVTQDQPNPRASRASAVSAFACATFHIATTAQPVSSGRFAAERRIDA
jgi:hypothetical protein